MQVEFYSLSDGILPIFESADPTLKRFIHIPVWSDVCFESEQALWDSFKGLPHMIPDGHKLVIVFRVSPCMIGDLFMAIFGTAVVREEYRPAFKDVPASKTTQNRFDEITAHLNQ